MSVLHSASFKEFGSSMCLWQALNFEKCNLKSGHRMWPGGVTFGVIGSSFFWKCAKLLSEQLRQIWRSYAPPFFRYLRKTWRGRITPAVRGLNILDSLVVWNNYDGGDIICMRNGKSYSRKFSPKTVMLTKMTYAKMYWTTNTNKWGRTNIRSITLLRLMTGFWGRFIAVFGVLILVLEIFACFLRKTMFWPIWPLTSFDPEV